MFDRLLRRAPASGNKPERHMPYFKFLEAAKAPGCPICGRVREAMDEWYENLLYESANDRPLRHRLDEDGGLCATHLRRLCSGREGDGLGTAVLYREILRRAAASLGGGAAPRLNRGSCAACDHEADAEARYAALVADFLGDEGMRAALELSGGLCLRHASAVMRARGEAPEWFLDLHRGKVAALLGTLDRYVASFELSTQERRAQQTREEELAWKGIAELLEGSID